MLIAQIVPSLIANWWTTIAQLNPQQIQIFGLIKILLGSFISREIPLLDGVLPLTAINALEVILQQML